MATQAVILSNPHNPRIRRFPLRPLYTCRGSSTNRPVFLQNKPNVKIGKMTVSIATLKAYAKKQRTMINERYSKQTQSKPISNAQTACPACRTRGGHGLVAPRSGGWRNTGSPPGPRARKPVPPRPSLSRAKHALSRVEGSREYPFCRAAGGVFACIGGQYLLY